MDSVTRRQRVEGRIDAVTEEIRRLALAGRLEEAIPLERRLARLRNQLRTLLLEANTVAVSVKRRRLQVVSQRVCDGVCSVHGYVTKADVDLLEQLEEEVGARWDAINQRWESIEGR